MTISYIFVIRSISIFVIRSISPCDVFGQSVTESGHILARPEYPNTIISLKSEERIQIIFARRDSIISPWLPDAEIGSWDNQRISTNDIIGWRLSL